MLIEKLKKYSKSGVYPMHMPGHKRNLELLPSGLPYEIDITEIYDFDDLHNPSGILHETARLAAKLYGSTHSFPLVNGSTVGILAAIGAHTNRGDKILVAQKCHWSVDNAATLFGLESTYLTPTVDEASCVSHSISPDAVGESLDKNPDAKLVVVTSPSYEGVVSDIAAIAEVAHCRGIPLFVDSAHGAHLGFSKMFPKNAVQSGADIAVMSLHKTLPALTQCSLLHLCSKRTNTEETKRLLSVLQTSSPSYILMASIDACLRVISAESERLFKDYEQNLERFSKNISALEKLSVLNHGKDKNRPCFFDFDPGKLVIVTKGTSLSGFELSDILRNEHKIELERACDGYAIAMTSICDSSEGLERLAEALAAIDNTLCGP
ncbi:MAG: aminotransferase class I/II-fold pyridoxal phosphate-dependent enzyme [Oscillospiraceae bacterium]|nr:aminotransferase class I/II-fold pyridoxal phosphate-dependent enzyme [Oscillospiraceae bacterium]